MSTLRRWCAVALGVAIFAGAVVILTHLPARESGVSAQRLLADVRAAEDAPYSGVVRTTGALQLPVTDRFSDLGELFGGSTTLRVWWRGGDDFRVSRLLPTGEDAIVGHGSVTSEWSYERMRVVESGPVEIRLPRTDDLLPPAVARRLLEDVRSAEATRLPARRIAGHATLGLRVEPAAPQASVDHVDLWVDEQTSVPLRVEVYGAGSSTPAFTSGFASFSGRRPAATTTRFVPPEQARVNVDQIVDIADAANRYADVVPPAELAGLTRSTRSDGAVGVYGRGITELIAIPLWGQVAGPLRTQLAGTPGVRVTPDGSALRAGPLAVEVTGDGRGNGWLLAGSVTDAALTRATADLLAGQRPRDDRNGVPG